MIINSLRTIYGLNLQLNMLTGKPHNLIKNTTLNEKFGVLNVIVNDTNIYPKLNYIAIGVGGADIIDNSSIKHSTHRPIDAALFEHIPFIIRRTDTDLTATEKAKYRFRVVQSINGVEYACYYLMVIPEVINKDYIYKVTTTNSMSTLSVLNTNDSSLLNPTPRVVNNYIDSGQNEYIAKVVKIPFILTVDDLDEINNAMEIIYGIGNIKKLTEIAIISGKDDIDVGGNIETYAAEVNYFVSIDIDTTILIESENGISRNIEIGGMEPMVL